MISRRNLVRGAALGVGGLATKRTTSFAREGSPPSARDTGLIAFHGRSANRTDQESIWVVETDGSRLLELTSELEGTFKSPDWSPDGNHLVFAETYEGRIWTIGADGSGASILVEPSDHTVFLQGPSWSPDGTRIAFTREEYLNGRDALPDSMTIQVLELATGQISEVLQLTSPDFVELPKWSPDSRSLVINVSKFDDQVEFAVGTAIALVPADGGEVTYVTPADEFAYYGDWNAATDRIVFDIESADWSANPDTVGDRWDLFSIAPDGSDRKRVTHVQAGERLWQPAWSSDGAEIVAIYGQDFDVFLAIIDVESGDFVRPSEKQALFPRFRPS